METLSQVQKNRVLKMIIKTRKKRKVQRVNPVLTVDNIPSQMYDAELSSITYKGQSEEVRENLERIFKGN